MKLLTKEQEQAHYHATLKGGFIGGFSGLALGALGVVGASRRYHFFHNLTIPLKAFLMTSAGTFGGIVTADHYSRNFERDQNPIQKEYEQREKDKYQEEHAGQTFTERAMEFGKKERYKIVGASWIASMFTAFALVNRNKYLSGPQKLVQARVYAQFLTLGVLVASAAFEISDSRNETGRYETVKYVDPHDPEHKRMLERQKPIHEDTGDELWKDMVAAEEERLKAREDDEARLRKQHHKKHESGSKGKSDKSQKPSDSKKEEEKPEKEEKEEKKGADSKKDKSEKGGQDKVPTANDAKEKK